MTSPTTPGVPVRLLDIQAVMAVTQLSESTVLRKVRHGVLPPPRKLGRGRGKYAAIRWLESELVDAIARLPVAEWAAKSWSQQQEAPVAATA